MAKKINYRKLLEIYEFRKEFVSFYFFSAVDRNFLKSYLRGDDPCDHVHNIAVCYFEKYTHPLDTLKKHKDFESELDSNLRRWFSTTMAEFLWDFVNDKEIDVFDCKRADLEG